MISFIISILILIIGYFTYEKLVKKILEYKNIARHRLLGQGMTTILNGLKTLDEPVKILDPEWNDWLEENQYLFGPMELMEGLAYITISLA